MTPLETLQKYNLKTDVKSIRERLYNPDNYFLELKITFPNTIDGTIKAINAEDIVHDADLALLCELAEKGERWERAVKKSKSELKSLISAIYDYDNGRKRYWDSTIAKERIKTLDEIITEAEGETKCSPRSK